MSQAMRYVVLQHREQLTFVEMPASYAYQLSALNRRLQKEMDKLTASPLPDLPIAVAECSELELFETGHDKIDGLNYMNALEETFSSIRETSYPIISLLTEIRALQAQLEQWYEEEYEG